MENMENRFEEILMEKARAWENALLDEVAVKILKNIIKDISGWNRVQGINAVSITKTADGIAINGKRFSRIPF